MVDDGTVNDIHTYMSTRNGLKHMADLISLNWNDYVNDKRKQSGKYDKSNAKASTRKKQEEVRCRQVTEWKILVWRCELKQIQWLKTTLM